MSTCTKKLFIITQEVKKNKTPIHKGPILQLTQPIIFKTINAKNPNLNSPKFKNPKSLTNPLLKKSSSGRIMVTKVIQYSVELKQSSMMTLTIIYCSKYSKETYKLYTFIHFPTCKKTLKLNKRALILK